MPFVAVIPAVSELAPVVIDRGGYPSPFRHPCVSVAEIHLVAVIPAVLGGYPSEEKAHWIPD